MRAVHIEVISTPQERGFVWVLLAFRWETLVEMAPASEQIQQYLPGFATLAGLHESVHIADHDQSVPCTREKDSEALWGGHETDIVVPVAPRERDYHDVAFFSLVVV